MNIKYFPKKKIFIFILIGIITIIVWYFFLFLSKNDSVGLKNTQNGNNNVMVNNTSSGNQVSIDNKIINYVYTNSELKPLIRIDNSNSLISKTTILKNIGTDLGFLQSIDMILSNYIDDSFLQKENFTILGAKDKCPYEAKKSSLESLDSTKDLLVDNLMLSKVILYNDEIEAGKTISINDLGIEKFINERKKRGRTDIMPYLILCINYRDNKGNSYNTSMLYNKFDKPNYINFNNGFCSNYFLKIDNVKSTIKVFFDGKILGNEDSIIIISESFTNSDRAVTDIIEKDRKIIKEGLKNGTLTKTLKTLGLKDIYSLEIEKNKCN